MVLDSYSLVACRQNNKKGVFHTVALPFTIQSILMKIKNYGNSNISPSKDIIFKESSKESNILQDIETL
jgi:hypothetical protein